MTTDNLQKYGSEFQTKCISSLLSDRQFLERIFEILEPKMFEAEASQWIVEETKKYFKEYKSVPTPAVFKFKMDSLTKNIKDEKRAELLKSSIVVQLRGVYQKVTESDITFIKDEFLTFCINQSMKNAVLESADLVKAGEYNKIRLVVENALKAGMERDLGHDYVDDVEDRLSELARSCVPTGIPVLDGLLNGGLGKGELGFVIGPAGSGKCVGPNTEIEIEYEEIGLPFVMNDGKEEILWLNPFKKYKIGNFGEVSGHVLEKMFKVGHTETEKITQKIKIKELFDNLGISEKENEMLDIDFPLMVKTPYGYKQIRTAFRTEKQKPVTIYFKNNKTLKTSCNHLLKVNGEWKKVKDISVDDVIETEHGVTSILKNGGIKYKRKEEILYDISVEDVHCYYSNGILSHNSWILARLGTEAIKQGKNVLHFTMELNQGYTGLRYDSCFTGIAFQEVREHADKIRENIKKVRSHLNIKYFPQYSVSANDLKLYVDRYQTLTNKKIDLVIIDYADLLRPESQSKNSNSYHDGGSIYGELRGTAGVLQIPTWSASQSNRGGYSEDIVEAQHVADSFKKIMIGDFIMSLSRKREDKIHSIARIHIVKNRFGPDGMTFPAQFNTDCGSLHLFEAGSQEGMEIQNKMGDSDNSVKSLIKSKWNRNKADGDE